MLFNSLAGQTRAQRSKTVAFLAPKYLGRRLLLSFHSVTYEASQSSPEKDHGGWFGNWRWNRCDDHIVEHTIGTGCSCTHVAK
jgi:hypothetical protein